MILLDPAGRRFTQEVARELARRPHLVLVCGRYEGVDERVREQLVDEELSIGDYVLTGGELAALVVTEAVTRLLPGVLGDEAAPARDSFARGLLEHPQYTRPEVFRGVDGAGRLLLGRPRQDRAVAPRHVARGGRGSAGRICWRRRTCRPKNRSGWTGFRQGRPPDPTLIE